MNILHVLPSISSESGGPPRSTRATIKAVSQFNSVAENTILTTDLDLEKGWLEEYKHSLPSETDIKVCKQIGKHTVNISPQLFGWLYKNVREFDLIVVRAMLHPISTMSCYIARLRGVPYVITPHGTLSDHTFSHRNTLLKKIYYRLFESRSVNNAKYIQATSEFEKKQIEKRNIKSKVEIIPHPFNDEMEYSRDQAEHSSLLFMSRIDPMKGFDLLIPSIKQLKEEGVEFELNIAGSGEKSYESKIKNEIKEKGLGSIINFIGFIEGERKQQALEQAGIFILPSYRENYGIAVVEAMNAGLPVIITREVDIYPEVEEYNAGIVTRNNVSDIKNAILKLLNNRILAEQMGRNGKMLVAEKFSPEVIGEQIFELYNKASKG